MYLVIYEKVSKRILDVVEYKEGMIYGYSENCAEMIVEEKPTGKFLEN